MPFVKKNEAERTPKSQGKQKKAERFSRPARRFCEKGRRRLLRELSTATLDTISPVWRGVLSAPLVARPERNGASGEFRSKRPR